jgi:DNA-binding MarR family transcriptional regulator
MTHCVRTLAFDKKDATPVSRSQRQRQIWTSARRFQESVQEALATEGITFMEWLLLETLQELITERGDAVSQADLARRTGISDRVISYWMRQMTEYGAVDRGPTPDGRAWRVILTRGGERSREQCNQRLEAAGLTG